MIPLLDLQAQYAKIQPEIEREVARVFASQRFIMGPDVEKLEREVAAYCGARFGVGCASGSDAILLALKALGVGPGDEVLTVPYTFFATAGYVVHSGAQPVFVDVSADTFNMDVSLVEAALDRHPKVKVIMPVHLFGACADMDTLLEIARRRGLAVVEDAAQSIGAEYKGRRAGSMGAINCFSFYPGKNLGAFGDAGMMTTDDEALDARLRALRQHGGVTRYVHEWVGWNSRLDALQAAVLSVKLKYLDEWTEARRANAALYERLFAAAGMPVVTPVVAGYATRHVMNQFVIRCLSRRDELRSHLAEREIGCEVYYPIPLHLQACFAYLGYRPGSFPVSEQLAKQTLALPVHPQLTVEDVERVAEVVGEFYRGCG